PRTMAEGLAAGRLEFALNGDKLRGRFALIRMKRSFQKGKENWLLIKVKDEHARRGADTADRPGAVKPPRRTKRAGPRPPAPNAAPPPGSLAFTHTEKVLFPDAVITKGDVLRYYERIAPRLLPFLRDRPVTLERLPEGLGKGKPHFWQKDTPAYYPDWIPRVELATERGKPVHYVLVNDKPTLLYLVNLG